MHVMVHPTGARLVEAEDVRAFDVVVDPRLDGAALAAALDGVGEHEPAGEHPGGHVRVRLDWLRAQAAQQGLGAAWQQAFDGMVGYAASKGWVDAERTTVRGHVVAGPAPTA